MRYTIGSEALRVVVDTHGAEVVSIVDLRTGRECVWNGDAAWWKRHAPILFPIVGSLWHGTMRHQGKEYKMSQHGFARDMEFEPVAIDESSAEFVLKSNAATKERFPFDFELKIKHTVQGDSVTTQWTVLNVGTTEMHFQIGGHPAYMIPNLDPKADVAAYVTLPADGKYRITEIGTEGCVQHGDKPFDQTEVAITLNTFAKNALIFESPCPQKVELYDRHHTPVLTFSSACPALGIWAPHKDIHAPFVCIEPWWGRTDRVDYEGEFKDREYISTLAPAEAKSGDWTVRFH